MIRSTLLTVCGATVLAAALAAHAAGPLSWETTAVYLGATDGVRTADDVIANPFNASQIFVAQTGGTSQQAIVQFTLTRSGGKITGATKDWTSVSTLMHNDQGLKALDIYDADTIFYTLEEGQTFGGTDDGEVGRLTALSTTRDHAAVAGLRYVRTGGVSDYDPEGIAIDRANNLLYVMTDDGPNTDVTQFAIDPVTGNLLQQDGVTSAATLTPTPNWTVTVEAGTTNGNDGIVLADGRVALVAGTTSVNIYAVSSDGSTVTNLLGGATGGTGRNTPQDLLEYGGYLYLAWESGIIDAFDLSSPSTTPVASLDLNTVAGLQTATLTLGGIDISTDGHLLFSTRADGGSTGEIYALNNTIPEPATMGLLGAGAIALIRRRRSGRQDA